MKNGDCAWCSKGRPGIITDYIRLEWGWSFVGIGLDDGSLWASRSPRRMTATDLEELRRSKVSSGTTA